MNFKYLNNFFLFFFVFSLSAFAQKSENRIDEEFPTPLAFPYEYFGEYSGNLRVSNNTGVIANVPTEFSIKKTNKEDEFIYTITYVKGKDIKDINTYRLFTIDQDKGFYAIKDNNGIEFTAILIDNTLYSTFEINNNIMFTTLEFTNDGKVRLKIILSQKINKKKNKEFKIDQARSSNVMSVQKAVLSKVNN